jgi:hypothetical protein
MGMMNCCYYGFCIIKDCGLLFLQPSFVYDGGGAVVTGCLVAVGLGSCKGIGGIDIAGLLVESIGLGDAARGGKVVVEFGWNGLYTG